MLKISVPIRNEVPVPESYSYSRSKPTWVETLRTLRAYANEYNLAGNKCPQNKEDVRPVRPDNGTGAYSVWSNGAVDEASRSRSNNKIDGCRRNGNFTQKLKVR